jgi:hypothetical protein
VRQEGLGAVIKFNTSRGIELGTVWNVTQRFNHRSNRHILSSASKFIRAFLVTYFYPSFCCCKVISNLALIQFRRSSETLDWSISTTLGHSACTVCALIWPSPPTCQFRSIQSTEVAKLSTCISYRLPSSECTSAEEHQEVR